MVVLQLYKAGIEKPTPIQAQSWPLAMQGRDIIAVAKSGSGRKLGFLIPGFIHAKRLPKYPNRDPTVLVLCPTDAITAKVLIEAINFGKPSGIKIKVYIYCLIKIIHCHTFVNIMIQINYNYI